jgi:hypothetical protein
MKRLSMLLLALFALTNTPCLGMKIDKSSHNQQKKEAIVQVPHEDGAHTDTAIYTNKPVHVNPVNRSGKPINHSTGKITFHRSDANKAITATTKVTKSKPKKPTRSVTIRPNGQKQHIHMGKNHNVISSKQTTEHKIVQNISKITLNFEKLLKRLEKGQLKKAKIVMEIDVDQLELEDDGEKISWKEHISTFFNIIKNGGYKNQFDLLIKLPTGVPIGGDGFLQDMKNVKVLYQFIIDRRKK